MATAVTWKPRKFLVGTIPSASLTFPCISQSDKLKSSQNFENLSIIKNFGFRATVFCSIHKTITLNFSVCGFIKL